MLRFKYVNLTYLSIFVGLMLTYIHLSAHAEPILLNSIESAASEIATTSEPEATQNPSSTSSQEVLAANQVPKLTLRWDCAPCTQNEKVIPLIEESYTNIAAAKGYSVGSEAAEVVIQPIGNVALEHVSCLASWQAKTRSPLALHLEAKIFLQKTMQQMRMKV